MSEVRADEVIVNVGRRRQRWSFEDDNALAEVLMRLRNEGVPFLDSTHGWPPASVFEELRDRGLANGSFTTVTWSGPDAHLIQRGR